MTSRPKALRILVAALLLLAYIFFVLVRYSGRYDQFDEPQSPTDTPPYDDTTQDSDFNGTMSARVRTNEIRDFVPVVNYLATNEGPNETSTRIAYIILVHNIETIMGATTIIERLYDPKHTFVVHLDAKATIEKNVVLRQALAKFKVQNSSDPEHFKIKPDNNLIILQNHAINWCGFTMIQATFDMISAALQTGRWFDSVVLLSGSCHPVKPPLYIENKIKELRGRLILNLDGGPGYENRAWRTKDRYDLYRMDYYYDYEELPMRVKEFDEFKKNYPKDLIRMTGSQWVFLSREFCEYVITSPWVKKLFIAHSTSHCADENMFQFIARNSPFVNQTFNQPRVDLKLRYELWRDNQPSPSPLNETTVVPAIEGHALFARKLPAIPVGAIRKIVDNLVDEYWKDKMPDSDGSR